MHRKVPLKLTSTSLHHASGSASSSGPTCVQAPAALTRSVGGPRRAATCVDQTADGSLVRHVGRVRQRAPAGRLDRGSRGDDLALGARRQGDGCSGVGERLGDRATDASASAGDDRDLTPER